MKGLNVLIAVAALMCSVVIGAYAQAAIRKRKPYARQHHEKRLHDIDNSGKMPEYWSDLSIEDPARPGRWFTYECWPNGKFVPLGWKDESRAHAGWRLNQIGEEPDDFWRLDSGHITRK